MSRRIVVLTEGHSEPHAGKTAASVIRYRTSEVVALLDSTQVGRTSQELLGTGGNIPVVAKLADVPTADTLLIGIAPQGGKLPASWQPILLEAITRKMDIVNGLHDFLTNDPLLVAASKEHGTQLDDVRKNNERDVALRQGIRRDCLRIHTVGNDCSIGKMVASIEISRALNAAGHDSKFVATGQTGIMIEGDGCPIDCVVSDFVNGAAERLILQNQHHEILLIEGQGSLLHPAYSAVTLGLLHGTQPDGLILCYESARPEIHNYPGMKFPNLPKLREIYEQMANLMNPCRVIGIVMNSRRISAAEADVERNRVEQQMGLPCCDVFRHGVEPLVAAVLRRQAEVGKGRK
jgi:uncharacterized NAD-dependent epimerase/dehydratase family protein